MSNLANLSLTSTVQTYVWNWQNQTYSLSYETWGTGQPVLLLPAFSTVSTRAEMKPLAEKLAPHFQVTALDWLGFGTSERPPVEYEATLYRSLLQDFAQAAFSGPVAVVAAGHASGYVLQVARDLETSPWSKIALVAPTWRGPLPTMGANEAIASSVRTLVRSPLVGQALYQANTTPSFLRLMYGRHVYLEQSRLTPEFIAQKRAITQQPGARFAPAAFVTGGLDPVKTREDFLDLAQSISVPFLAIIAEQAPGRSKAEMEALCALANVETHTLKGTLGLHEEYADDVADVVLPFLQR